MIAHEGHASTPPSRWHIPFFTVWIGQAFSLIGSLLWITSPFSLAVAGPVTDWLGIRVWYLAAGLLCAGMGVAGFFVPALVNIEENVNGHGTFPETVGSASPEPVCVQVE